MSCRSFGSYSIISCRSSIGPSVRWQPLLCNTSTSASPLLSTTIPPCRPSRSQCWFGGSYLAVRTLIVHGVQVELVPSCFPSLRSLCLRDIPSPYCYPFLKMVRFVNSCPELRELTLDNLSSHGSSFSLIERDVYTPLFSSESLESLKLITPAIRAPCFPLVSQFFWRTNECATLSL